MLEQTLHLLKVAAVHENRTNAAQKFVKVDILFLTFVQQCENSFKNLRWVLQAKHFGDFYEVEAFNT